MSRESKAPSEPFEQLKLPIPPPLLTWVVIDEKSVPILTRKNIKDFSRERTGSTNLGTRIANSVERALGYNPYYNPASQGYDVEDVLAVLEDAKDNPDDRAFWWLGEASMKLFQNLCDTVEGALAKK